MALPRGKTMNTKNLKPFDLESALNGEPVMLRDGRKAFVRRHETELPVLAHSCLWGVAAHESMEYIELKMWSKNGRYVGEELEHSEDIIGMYPKTRIINGFEVPAPVREELEVGDMYFVPSVGFEDFHDVWEWGCTKLHKLYLERGVVFLSKEDAIANAKAMLGIDPYDKAEK